MKAPSRPVPKHGARRSQWLLHPVQRVLPDRAGKAVFLPNSLHDLQRQFHVARGTTALQGGNDGRFSATLASRRDGNRDRNQALKPRLGLF